MHKSPSQSTIYDGIQISVQEEEAAAAGRPPYGHRGGGADVHKLAIAVGADQRGIGARVQEIRRQRRREDLRGGAGGDHAQPGAPGDGGGGADHDKGGGRRRRWIHRSAGIHRAQHQQRGPRGGAGESEARLRRLRHRQERHHLRRGAAQRPPQPRRGMHLGRLPEDDQRRRH